MKEWIDSFGNLTGLTENQNRLVITRAIAFLVQVLFLYLAYPERVQIHLVVICLIIALAFNVYYYKLFSD